MAKITKIILASLVLCAILILVYINESKPHDLEVYYLDVGQGDAILIRTPDNQDILIDGGPDDNILLELSKILPFWDRDIELVILTHPHDDHVAGLVPVLKRYQVDQVWYTEADYDNPNYKQFQEIITQKNIPHTQVFYNQILDLNNIQLEVLYPFINTEIPENINNISTVIKLVNQENKFLFTGDAEEEVEEALIHNQIDVSADVLKAGHHGSKTASTLEFLKAVTPSQIIIQCGLANKFSHPHFKTLYNLENLNLPVLRNDLDGTIKCESDGSQIKCYNIGT